MESKKTILITGAASGIGRKISEILSKEYCLILSDRDESKLKETLELCSNKENHITLIINLQELESIKPKIESFLSKNEISINGFVHSAGMMKIMKMKTVGIKDVQQIFSVNLFSAIEIISTLLKKKINDSNLENIVFISAILGNFGATAHNLYSSTKAGIDGLMRSLALELAPKTRVNSVLPGGVKTPMSELAFSDPEILAKAQKEYPLGIGDPIDIAKAVEFLLSDNARWVTGQQFIVDGGRSINLSQK